MLLSLVFIQFYINMYSILLSGILLGILLLRWTVRRFLSRRGDPDPAADFLAREQAELGEELGEELGISNGAPPVVADISGLSLEDQQELEAVNQELAQERTSMPSPDWERVTKLCDFSGKNANKNSTKDMSRMRSILINLKQQERNERSQECQLNLMVQSWWKTIQKALYSIF